MCWEKIQKLGTAFFGDTEESYIHILLVKMGDWSTLEGEVGTVSLNPEILLKEFILKV